MAETTSRTDPPRRAVFFQGRIVDATEARLPAGDAGVLYGLGFFETFRTSGGRPHHWRFNQARLQQACATAGIVLPPTFLARDEVRLADVVRGLLKEHQMNDAVFRYTVTSGCAAESDARGDIFPAPTEFMTLRALPPPPPAEGIALRVLNLSRDNGEWLPRPKSLNYANAFAGADELRRRRAAPADEGLFLSRSGARVVETARQNLAWFEGETFCYPDPVLGAVAGTCLEWALQLFPAAEPRRALLPDLFVADAVVVLNAVRGITPVREVWDAQDQNRFRVFDSAANSHVVRLVQRWNEALRASAVA
ncbi:MAG TPA: aminotransferase class IV [Opitutaceae bacterium]|nr:aminotransferase class IV [Opitutaceae bacterium]